MGLKNQGHKSVTSPNRLWFLNFFRDLFFCFVGLRSFGNAVPRHSLVSRLSESPSNMGGISQHGTEQSGLCQH